MIKRFSVVSTISDAASKRANVTGGYVCVCELTPARWLIKQTLPDGTPTTSGWVADVTIGADGRQTDVTAAALTLAQFNTAKTWITNQGVNTSTLLWTDVKDRRALILWLLRRLAWWQGWNLAEIQRLVTRGYEVA